MKIMLGSGRQHYLRRASILLVIVALMAGMVGCGGESYTLTITSTEGGSVTTPGEGAFTYPPVGGGFWVDLIAKPKVGYCFVNWTGDVDTVADVNSAKTAITINGNYSITANFMAVCELTIASTAGGSVTKPGEGKSDYEWGAVVDLVAEPDEGYHFVRWTGDVATVDDIHAATTNITVNGSYYIAANFVDTIEIRDWYDLDAIRYSPRGYFILMNDLNFSTPGYDTLASPTANGGKGWQPIGNYSFGQGEGFADAFDGGGYEIRDLFVNRPDENDVGLFGYAESGAVIKHVSMVNATVTGSSNVGTLIGLNDGTVSDSYSIASVTADSYVGGLVGLSRNGMMMNCYCEGNVDGGGYVGGLTAVNQGTVSNCYFDGNVTGEYNVGGLVGYNSYTVNNSYSTGKVIANWNVGGLVAYNVGDVISSYSTASMTGRECVGGLVGANDGSVIICYSSGSVTGDQYVGGLVGANDGSVSNSFWDTATSGQATSDGGTGKNTTEMQDITTFSGASWNIIAVANPSTRNPAYIWNIVDDVTYPFLSWQPVS